MFARMGTMSTTVAKLSDPLPTAKQAMEMLAQAQAERASAALRHKKKADDEKKALIDKLSAPSGISEQEAVQRATEIIQRAIKNGLTEVEVARFPKELFSDHGRAINNYMELGWENTLTGLPKEMYDFWNRHLHPLGYKLSVRVVDYSGGVPGDIGFTLKWS
jgi:hypothetical protein